MSSNADDMVSGEGMITAKLYRTTKRGKTDITVVQVEKTADVRSVDKCTNGT